MDNKKRRENLALSLDEVVTPELCAAMARAYRRMVDALKAEKFSEPEAIDIVVTQGLSFNIK